MQHPQPLLPALFVRRENRFRATILLNGKEVSAHVPNSGRLLDLFTPQRPLYIHPAANPNRKTPYDLKLVQLPNTLVSVDARLPNHLFAEALAAGRLPEFPYESIYPEVNYGHSRLDFRLEGAEGSCWVEIKSITWVRDGVASFPDAPTTRGSKHLRELTQLAAQGHRAAVIFIVQRNDATAFAPAADIDPQFTETLRQAAKAGVEVRAYGCRIDMKEIVLESALPVQV